MRHILKVLLVAVPLATSFSSARAASALLLYNDDNDFFGCLNCGEFSSDSVCNEFGKYGSEFSSTSIWNEFGKAGSEFSSDSPWNEFGSGLKIVDSQGGFYGRFSANEFAANRTSIEVLNKLTEFNKKVNDLDKTGEAYCK